MRTLLLLLFSMLLLGGPSAHAAYKVVPADLPGCAQTTTAKIAVAVSSHSITVSSGSTRAERRLQRLLHRVHRLLPDGKGERVDTNSLLALIFGAVALISLSFFPFLILLSIPALILGIVGLGRVKRDGTKGKGIAIAGIITGALGILVMLAGLVAAIVILSWLVK